LAKKGLQEIIAPLLLSEQPASSDPQFAAHDPFYLPNFFASCAQKETMRESAETAASKGNSSILLTITVLFVSYATHFNSIQFQCCLASPPDS
jgi:hypothetical protein